MTKTGKENVQIIIVTYCKYFYFLISFFPYLSPLYENQTTFSKLSERHVVCHRGKSCSWSGRRCVVWGIVFLAMTLNITPWTPWSRACRVSWTDYTLWTPSADMTEGYTHPRHLSVTWRVMSRQHMTFDSLPFVIASSSRRNLNHQDAEPTRQTVTLGQRAQVSQTKSLSCSEFVILCSVSTAPKSDCFALYTAVYEEGNTGWEAFYFVVKQQFAVFVIFFQKWPTHTAAQDWTRPSPLKCSTSQIARSHRFW